MPSGAGGWLLLGFSFVLTFLVARTAGKWFRRGRARKAQEAARLGESRQVRRARERRGRS